MKKIILTLMVIALLAGCAKVETQVVTQKTVPQDTAITGVEDTVVFVLTGQNFRFYLDGQESPELRVKVGDKVRIEFTSTDGFHDWKVDEFSAATEKVRPGTPTSVEFVADKTGTFEYYCSVGEHRAMGMKGNLIVE